VGNFLKDDVIYTLCPRNDDSYAFGRHWQRAPVGDDVIIGGDIYRVTAVDSRLDSSLDATATPHTNGWSPVKRSVGGLFSQKSQ